ncbi:MAG: 23S rRNA (adenine(2503)-C(2))-methyltransferase RlmN [Firmicutes bacterium]|nr:23S rRNA (adenine(2503)-C(2))-methyltransferase RlmN [Bacillota bacterium]
MFSLQDLNQNEIIALTVRLGEPQFRAKQIHDMVLKNKDYSEVTNIPAVFKEKLKSEYTAVAVRLKHEIKNQSGVKKYLYELNDGNIIEGVYMPHGYGDTLCVSTQVGCRMGCAFCASGIGGLVRNLTAGEILGQVLLANRLNGGVAGKRAVTNIVLMGSGEPLDNYDNLIKFLELVTAENGLNVSARNISVSTVGIPDKIKLLAKSGFPVTLSISLHAPTNEKRNRLIPLNQKHNIEEIIKSAKYYVSETGRRVIFEYATSETVTDEQSAKELANLLRGFQCHLNLIPLNFVKEKAIKPASPSAVKSFEKSLSALGLSVTARRSLGADIAGACGQLRNTMLRS